MLEPGILGTACHVLNLTCSPAGPALRINLHRPIPSRSGMSTSPQCSFPLSAHRELVQSETPEPSKQLFAIIRLATACTRVADRRWRSWPSLPASAAPNPYVEG